MHFLEELKSFDIILASQSKRRHELMASAGIPFRALTTNSSEEFPDGHLPQDVALMLARRKAEALSQELHNKKTVIVAADTIVVFQGKILNKPSGYEHAKTMLTSLSGQMHKVITGVCIANQSTFRCFYETTLVYFKELSGQEIDYYLTNFRPYDKAGSYGIQEWIGLIGVNRIEGSYTNVVGLPVERVISELRNLLSGREVE